MNPSCWSAGLLAVMLCAPPTDPTPGSPSLTKEPHYQGKPRYCLLVFGAEAKQRVWLVLDGDVLYADRNGDGDLTDRGERIAEREVMKVLTFQVGEVLAHAGQGRYTGLQVWRADLGDGKDFALKVKVHVKGRGWQGFWYGLAPLPRLGGRPGDAPVFHFDGPLAMFADPGAELVRGEQPNELRAYIATPGRGRAFAFMDVESVPADVHPVAVIDFPGRGAGSKPIRVTYPLTGRC